MGLLSASGIVAGYTAADEILKGRRFRRRGSRDRLHHRPERRRQIDAAENHRGAAATLAWRDRCCAVTRLRASPPREITRLGVAYVPQEHNIFPTMSVRENLEMGGYVDEAGTRARISQSDGAVSDAGAQAPARGAHAVGRRAADPRHGDGADGRAEPAAARRAFRGPFAGRRRSAVREYHGRSTATGMRSRWWSRTPARRSRSRIAPMCWSMAATAGPVRQPSLPPTATSSGFFSECNLGRRRHGTQHDFTPPRRCKALRR